MPALADPMLEETVDQTAFNLAAWQRILDDPALASLPHRIESDRFGNPIMIPPASQDHGAEQFALGTLLRAHLPTGVVITECPISTSEGVKAADVAWIERARWQAERTGPILLRAPEICVEVFSPGNTLREMLEKKRLYFEAGAEEVWFCRRGGKLEHYLAATPGAPGRSQRCLDFPLVVEV